MHILSVKLLKTTEKKSVEIQHGSFLELMKSAAKSLLFKFQSTISPVSFSEILVISGPGNNGGDGIVFSTLLSNLTSLKVTLCILDIGKKKSDLNKRVLKEALINNQLNVYSIENQNEIPEISENTIVIDAIFGYGLNRPLKSDYKDIITHLNSHSTHLISLDIPSGLYSDRLNNKNEIFIQPSQTFVLHSPKKSFFLSENRSILKDSKIVDIGMKDLEPSELTACDSFVQSNHPFLTDHKRAINSYKGSVGRASVIGGSIGMAGAPFLSARAALKSGCGYSSLVSCSEVLRNFVDIDLLTNCTNEGSFISTMPFFKNQTYAIGPGLGRNETTIESLKSFLKQNIKPLVIDADALSIIGDADFHSFIPRNSILTPHEGEFRKLISNDWNNGQEKLDLLRKFSIKNECITVLKGPFTCISDINGKLYFNSTGNSALSVAGSGDVLTGIIVSLLAQGMEPLVAAVKGVYIHGLAADLYVKKHSEHSLTPDELMEWIDPALKELKESVN